MDNVQVIGKRSSILLKDNVFSLVILPTDNKRKVHLLFFWLMAWTVSGMVVLANYFTLTHENAKLFMIIWLGFWAYFEFKIVRVFMWKRFGKEKLWIKHGRVYYQQEISGRGKLKEYDLNLTSDFSIIAIEKANFADAFAQSFWVKGGERIEFRCQSQLVKFGMQLSDEESKSIATSINRFIKGRKS